jgi:hypothetical protein
MLQGAHRGVVEESADTGKLDLLKIADSEISRWYALFFSWSRGKVPKSLEHVQPLYDAFALDFRVILTDGRLMGRDAYCERLWGLHGVREGSPPSQVFNLSIEVLAEGWVLAVFDLIKDRDSGKKVDSSLLRIDRSAPTGISWVYVHESQHALI